MLTNIKHIVHVMFENRSIDNVLDGFTPTKTTNHHT